MTMTIGGTSGLVFPDSSTQNTAATGFGFKNRIINGAMMIDQRNAGAATANTINGYTLDRWSATQYPSTGKIIVQQNAGAVTPPVGFSSYLGVTSQAAYSIGSGDFYMLQQPIEGNNIADLNWGTANAATVTLSFWVRSSLTGTFGGALRGPQNYPFTYTISSANTWEQKTIIIAGSTSGSWAKDNSAGITVAFGLGVGSTYSATAGSWTSSNIVSATGATSVVGTNGATFYITGVQLEKGSVATSFDYRPYGTELALCQRYFQKAVISGVSLSALGGTYFNRMFFIPMRAAPTISISGAWVGSTPSTNSINTETFYWSSGSTTFYSNSNVTELISAEL